MKVPVLLVACALGFCPMMPAVAQPAPATATAAVPATAPTLYKRLGGYDALAAVTDDFLNRLVSDPQFARFFGGHSSDSLKKIRQLIVDQLCAATGGPCLYIGRDMKITHAGLGITEKDWDVTAKHLVATLDKFAVPVREKDEVLSAVSGLKKDIVEKP
jgi:hemoglobin